MGIRAVPGDALHPEVAQTSRIPVGSCKRNRRSLHCAALRSRWQILHGNCQLSNGFTLVHGSTNLSSRPKRTRISYFTALDTTTCAAFLNESRMKLTSATDHDRKSGVA